MHKQKPIKKILLFLTLPILLLANPKPINEKWLETDKSNFMNLMKATESNSSNLEYYKKNIQLLNIKEEESIGFGMKRVQAYQIGGYISNVMSIFTYENQIFYFHISINGKDVDKMRLLEKRDSNIQQLLYKHWKEHYYHIYLPYDVAIIKQLKYEVIFNKKIYSKFKEKVASQLGSFLDIPVDSSLKSDYDILTTPFERYSFGTFCGYAGAEPKGRKAIGLIKTEKPELLKNIIRGYSPEGRIYGIEALLELVSKGTMKLSNQDQLTIKKVLSLKTPIKQCGGCMSSTMTAKQIFQRKEYKELVEKTHLFLF